MVLSNLPSLEELVLGDNSKPLFSDIQIDYSGEWKNREIDIRNRKEWKDKKKKRKKNSEKRIIVSFLTSKSYDDDLFLFGIDHIKKYIYD